MFSKGEGIEVRDDLGEKRLRKGGMGGCNC